MHGRSPCREGTLRLHAREYFSSTILDKINGTSGPPLPPFQRCQNGAFLAPSRLHHCFAGGRWGIIVPFYTVQDCSSVRDFGKYSRGCSRTVSDVFEQSGSSFPARGLTILVINSCPIYTKWRNLIIIPIPYMELHVTWSH